MTTRQAVPAAPGPLEAYAASFDALFAKTNQRHAFCQYLEGVLLPAERNKTLTALANTVNAGYEVALPQVMGRRLGRFDRGAH